MKTYWDSVALTVAALLCLRPAAAQLAIVTVTGGAAMESVSAARANQGGGPNGSEGRGIIKSHRRSVAIG